VLNNLKAILEEAGTTADNIVKATIFLSSMEHYAAVNKAYLEFFTQDPKPVSMIFLTPAINIACSKMTRTDVTRRAELVLQWQSSHLRVQMLKLNVSRLFPKSRVFSLVCKD
jgi:hypothetical protein